MENAHNKGGLIARHAKIATVLAVIFGATSGILGSLISASSMAIGFWRLTIALPFFIVPAMANKEKESCAEGNRSQGLSVVLHIRSLSFRPFLFMVQCGEIHQCCQRIRTGCASPAGGSAGNGIYLQKESKSQVGSCYIGSADRRGDNRRT